jgi:RNA polymerase sigma-70 factor (ECF subfamily)
MTEDVRPILSDYLSRHYASLKRRVTRLLGNGDLAGDALQDTWLRLQSREEEDAIQSPGSYLVRVAVNIAMDIQRRQSRSLSIDEVQSLMELSDPAPGPARTAELRSEVTSLLQLIDRMPERRRTILMLVRWEGLPQKEVAARLGLSVRVVEHELKRAHDFLDARMNHDKK